VSVCWSWQDGSTPLNAAASNGHDVVVRLLLESKAAADTVNKVSVTAWEWRIQPCVESKRAVVRVRVLVREMLVV
jgi:hypothetical protein